MLGTEWKAEQLKRSLVGGERVKNNLVIVV